MAGLLGVLRESFWFVCPSEAPLQPESMLRHVTRRASEVLADLEEHGRLLHARRLRVHHLYR